MSKIKLDKYYTPDEMIQICIDELSKVVDLKEYHVIEPSAGDGRWKPFLEESRKLSLYDIEPDSDEVSQLDFIEDSLEVDGKSIFIGNPPFGKACSLAIKFFNKAASYKPDYIAYILPVSFGKRLTIRNKLSREYSVKVSVELPEIHFEPNAQKGFYQAESSRLHCVFQIWERKPRKNVVVPETNGYKIVRPSNHKILDENGISREQPVGDIDVDFTIITHGTRAGQIVDFDGNVQKVSVCQFVKVDDDVCIEDIRRKFEETDFSYFTGANAISSQSSLSTAEIICCVEGSDYKLM
jgi:hypothetical protein